MIPPAPGTGRRWVSAAELVLGAGVVLGHNVWRVLPNEVPILTLLGLVSFRIRNGGWAAMGLRRPPSWTRIGLIALAAAAARLLLGELVVDPFTSRFWPPATPPSGTEQITGNPTAALRWLLLVWTFAAFGEEIAYRGYLVNRAADVGHGSRTAWWIAVLLGAVLFGYGHYYKGPAGIVDSGMAGLILGIAYLAADRNLWAPILAHGIIDTVGVAALYLGWAS
jgi:membrane protease YdiL (CAAX protease family)